jgi:hypothetical protein
MPLIPHRLKKAFPRLLGAIVRILFPQQGYLKAKRPIAKTDFPLQSIGSHVFFFLHPQISSRSFCAIHEFYFDIK